MAGGGQEAAVVAGYGAPDKVLWGGGGGGRWWGRGGALFLARPTICPGVKMCTHSGGRGGLAPTGNTLKVQ